MAEGMSTCHAERIMSNSMASTSSQADNLSGAQWTAVRGAGTVQTPCIVCRTLGGKMNAADLPQVQMPVSASTCPGA